MPRISPHPRPNHDLATLLGAGSLAGLADGELLDRFVHQRDEAAVAALVRRHGAMVLGVCRRVLRDPHDADDAFQATFLVLARRAGAVRPADQVARWLHGVAWQTARKARALRARRRGREVAGAVVPEVAAPPDRSDPDQAEWLARLDRAIATLPGRYRSPVVLCLLEGRTHREAADLLGWPVGTVSGRLSRGRALLARRVRASVRGGAEPLALPLLVGPPLLPGQIAATARAMILWGLGRSALTTLEMAPILFLTREVICTMTMSKIKLLAALVLGVGLMVAGGVGLVPAPPPAEALGFDAPLDPRLKPLQGLWAGTMTEPNFEQSNRGVQATVQVLVEEDRLSVRGVLWGRFVAMSPDLVMAFRATLPADPVEPGPRVEPAPPTPERLQQIDLTNAPEPDDIAPTVNRGIYRLAGDSLQLCLSLPNKRRPERLVIEPKTNQILLDLRRSPDRTWGDLREHNPATDPPLPAVRPGLRRLDSRFDPIPAETPAAPLSEPRLEPVAPSRTPPASARNGYSLEMNRAIQGTGRALTLSPELQPDLIAHLQQLLALDPKTVAPTSELMPWLVYTERNAWQALSDRRRQVAPKLGDEEVIETLKQGPHDRSPGKRGELSTLSYSGRTFVRWRNRPDQPVQAGATDAAPMHLVELPADGSVETDLGGALARILSCRILRAEDLTRDAMVLSERPDWNHGDSENLGISNQHGGNWTLADWKPIPPEEAQDANRRFFLAFYSATTHSTPDDPGPIQALEILEDWPERVSWRTKPKLSPRVAASFRFEAGEGWKLFDITPLIGERARQGQNGHGVALRFEWTSPNEEVPLSDYQMVNRAAIAYGGWQSKRPRLLIVEPLSEAARL